MGQEGLRLIKYTPPTWRNPQAISTPQRSWTYRRSGVRGTNTPQGVLWGPKMCSDMATVQSHGMIVCLSVWLLLYLLIYLLAGCLAGWQYTFVGSVCVCVCVCVSNSQGIEVRIHLVYDAHKQYCTLSIPFDTTYTFYYSDSSTLHLQNLIEQTTVLFILILNPKFTK